MEQVVTHYGETIQEHSVEWYKKQLLEDWSVQFIKDSLLPQLFEWSNAYKAAVELTNKKKEVDNMTTTNFKEQYTEEEEKGEAIMTEQVEIIEVEVMDEQFGAEVIFPDYCLPSEEVSKKIEKALAESNATFYGGWITFEEIEKNRYAIDLSRPTILIIGNDENEVYYMDILDYNNLASDIEYFKKRVLAYEGTLNPDFEKVELTFSNPDEDFRSVSCIESYEITR